MKLYYRKNNFIVEFITLKKLFFFYLFKRITSFLIDISCFVIIQILFYWIIKVSIINSSLMVFALFLGYIWLCLLIFKNKTLGHYLTGLIITNFDGMPVKKNVYTWAFLYALYSIPIIGWILAFVSLVSLFLTRGLTFVDLFAKTQILNTYFYAHVNRMLRQVEQAQRRKDGFY